MIEIILPYLKNLNEVDFNPESKNNFSNALVRNWRVKGNNKLDAVFGKDSLFSRAKISTTAIISNSLFIDCTLGHELTRAPVVSFKKGIILTTTGRVDKIDNSLVLDSTLEVFGGCVASEFRNCSITGGKFTNCTFENCKIKNSTVMTSYVDSYSEENSVNAKFIANKKKR